jgi:hypothetical protein
MKFRRDSDLTAEAVADLKAIDAALTGAPVPDEQLETAALALALRDEAERPGTEFVARLDAAVHDGFPSPGTPGPARVVERLRKNVGAGRPRRLAPLALGTAASLFIVATALVSSGVLNGADRNGAGEQVTNGGRQSAAKAAPAVGSAPSSPSPGSDAAGGATAPEAAGRAGGAAAPAVSGQALQSPPLPAPIDVAPRAQARKVERSASLTLAANRDQVEDVADDVIRTTDRHGGFVLSSSVSSGEGDAGATLDLRIPSAKLPAALGDLSELAHVRSRTQNANDITARFSSPRRRLADASAERQGLLRQLARAQTPNQTASIRARLRLVNDRIDQARRDLRRLQNRVSYSAVSVTIDTERRGEGGSAGAWSAGDAIDDALSILGVAAGILLVVTAVLAPVTLLGLALWAGYRLRARRRRDQALS